LIDKRLNYAIDQVEARGLIAEFQTLVDDSAEMQASMIVDHQRYIDLRQSFISSQQQNTIEQLGFHTVLHERGIGGIADFQRIRCLHTYYAAHLVYPNTVGRMLDEHWRLSDVRFPHLSD